MELKTFEFSKELGWSVSRYDRFLNCKRQYFYDYYGRFDPEIPFEKIIFLKKMTSKPLEIGNIVHDTIRDTLRRYQKTPKPINKEKFYDYVHKMTLDYCQKTFSESYYGSDLISPEEIFERVKIISDNFLNSKRFQWIIDNALKTSSQWVIEPEGYGEMRIDEYKAHCKVDFLFPVDDKIYILDWKTGAQSLKKHKRQLVGYSLWANYHFNKPVKDIVPIIVYLYPQYQEQGIEVDDKIVADFAAQVKEEIENMRSYLVNVEDNIPKDKKEFPPTPNRLCAYCNYRELCKTINDD
ncbi:MAG: PD-(D/E)XK nuclease family protein [Elusimicrobiota bacterium]|jgi:CRISPR/Cas system-associated exonuclease Cas4 (RecB family)|nr:PD-(D/E)XK nuclease family protein [Elusimicrobiota bacterium]